MCVVEIVNKVNIVCTYVLCINGNSPVYSLVIGTVELSLLIHKAMAYASPGVSGLVDLRNVGVGKRYLIVSADIEAVVLDIISDASCLELISECNF